MSKKIAPRRAVRKSLPAQMSALIKYFSSGRTLHLNNEGIKWLASRVGMTRGELKSALRYLEDEGVIRTGVIADICLPFACLARERQAA